MNKYRIPSARAHWWNYGWNGAYFITICTKNREHLFGEIKNHKMNLSHLGIIADILWHEIPNHVKLVELGDFVVMPNHIHGILILNNPNIVETLHATSLDDVQTLQTDFDVQTLQTDFDVQTLQTDFDVQTLHATSLQRESESSKNNQMVNISPKSNSISTILRSYKSAVTKHANRLNIKNGWQPRFHDHIIRNDAEYQRISNYIINNPSKWEEDTFNN